MPKETTKENEIIYRDEVYKIIGAAMEVHSELGPGFLESVYEEALARECTIRNIPFETQVKVSVEYKGEPLDKDFRADFLFYDKILAELKSIPGLTKTDEAQIINYLKATKLKLGLLINFGSYPKLEWKRFIFSGDELRNTRQRKN